MSCFKILFSILLPNIQEIHMYLSALWIWCVCVFFPLYVVRSVSARRHGLQAGHRPSGGRHRQPHHSGDPQPRRQQPISRHLHHPVHAGHLSLTSEQTQSDATWWMNPLVWIRRILITACTVFFFFYPVGNPGEQPAFGNCQQDKPGRLGRKVGLKKKRKSKKILHLIPPTEHADKTAPWWTIAVLLFFFFLSLLLSVPHLLINSWWFVSVFLLCVRQWASGSTLLQGQTDWRFQHQQVAGHSGHCHLCTW